MRMIVALLVLMSIGTLAGNEGILPRQFTVDLAKKCQVLMLHVTPNRKSKKIMTHASYGDTVENMGCMREITQKELESIPVKKRDYIAWKYPVWCRVAVGEKQGWVQQQYLKNESLAEENDNI